MHTIRALIIFLCLMSAAQAVTPMYHIDGAQNKGEVIYFQQISSDIPTVIQWGDMINESIGKVEIKPTDRGYTYMFLIFKIKV